MDFWKQFISGRPKDRLPFLDKDIFPSEYVPVDLSVNNVEIQGKAMGNASICQSYLDTVLAAEKGKVAFGGYLEERNLYASHANFNLPEAQRRTVHLGVDFWCTAGTKVLAPLAGRVHSYQNNDALGDYGPTIILEHQWGQHTFHTLYGHLSLDSISGLEVGGYFDAGDVLARLGTPEINVGYAPHLHFQVILDMQGLLGDYPGVAAKKDLHFYAKNCPDPRTLLNF